MNFSSHWPFLLLAAHFFILGGLYFFPECKNLGKICLRDLKMSKKGENLLREMSLYFPGAGKRHAPDWGAASLQYKFYPSTVKELMALNQKWGTPLKAPWKQLKRDLYSDLQWHKRARAIVIEALFQQGTMSGFVLLFAYSLESLNPGGPSSLPGLSAFYLLGLVTLLATAQYWEHKTLAEGHLFWRGLIRLEVFICARLSVRETLAKSGLADALSGRDKDLEFMRRMLGESLESWQKWGHPLGETLSDLRQEYAFVTEQKMGQLLKYLKALQMAAAFIFILPSFFYLMAAHMTRFFGE